MMDGKPVPARIASSITTHTMLFFGIFAMGCILLSFNDLDMETTITTSIGMLANTGVALGMPEGTDISACSMNFPSLSCLSL